MADNKSQDQIDAEQALDMVQNINATKQYLDDRTDSTIVTNSEGD